MHQNIASRSKLRRMRRLLSLRGVVPALIVAGAALVTARPAIAQTLLETSGEARFQLDLHVPDAALAALVPPGFTLNVSAQGPAKDANLRVVFIDRIIVNGPDGKPVGSGSNRLVYMVAPVKDAAGANAQLVIGGLTEAAADTPGPFGVYLLATTHSMQRAESTGTGPILAAQDWAFGAATGERLEMHIKYERGASAKSPAAETKFYSAKNPATYQISKQEQALEILRNVTTNPPDKVKEFSFTASGGSYAKLFDGTQKVLSWDNFVWVNRSVLVP